jgi:hypothetical protein
MSDDTLREECEELLTSLIMCTVADGGYFHDPQKALSLALAFARAQQAKGLKEAAATVDSEEELPGAIPQEMFEVIAHGDDELVAEALRIVVRATKRSIKSRLEAQATARERETP